MQLQIAPSILAADFLNLGKDIRMLNSEADIIHLDVMDGTLVPNISFGFSVIDQVAGIATITMDAHLMVVNPQKWFEKLHKDGVQMVSFHYEAAGEHTGEYIDMLHSLGIKAGVAINPDVPVEKLFPYIGQADYFLIMSVFAGFGGQKFIPESLERIATLKAELDRLGSNAIIEVDGGVNMDNIKALKEAGAVMIVAGSTVFRSDKPGEVISLSGMPENYIPILLAKIVYPFERLFERIFFARQLE